MCNKCGATREFPPNPFEPSDTQRTKRAEQQAGRLARRIKQATDALLLDDILSLEELRELEYRKYERQEEKDYAD